MLYLRLFFKLLPTLARWIVWLKDLNCLLNLHRAKSEILLRTFKFRLCQLKITNTRKNKLFVRKSLIWRSCQKPPKLVSQPKPPHYLYQPVVRRSLFDRFPQTLDQVLICKIVFKSTKILSRIKAGTLPIRVDNELIWRDAPQKCASVSVWLLL